MQTTASPTTEVVLNQTVTEVADYVGHWRGQAFITHHTYGEQVHRTRDAAERWNAGRSAVQGTARAIRPTR
jgi:hypothetical protein